MRRTAVWISRDESVAFLLLVASNAFKDIVDERVHDGHSRLGDTSIGVDLLEDLVDVRRVRFGTLLVLLAANLFGIGAALLADCLEGVLAI
jgi:hypothetical protein